MIIAERKPMEEIRQLIAPYKKVLVAVCGTCVTVCWAGGEKEVAMLASQLRLARSAEGNESVALEATVERQCEREMVAEIKDKVADVEAVISLACGSGVQTMAEMFEDKPVFPGVNTAFIGMPEREGLWVEMCGACGDR